MSTEGFLLVDKPLDWTSHDVVAKLRGVTGIKKIGHGGTLDPKATGLLVIGIGKATKQLERYVQGEKTYVATVRLGQTSTTDDSEGELENGPSAVPPDEKRIIEVLEGFHGEQQQLPPAFSALKTGGRKHYELARAGKEVIREPRAITIYEVELVHAGYPDVSFRCRVSKGTYIRSIARDLGEKLGTGGYLAALRRESVGDLTLTNAVTLEELQEDWQSHLLPLSE
jgi:tRNA pseudouridine55 synthase